MGCHSNTHGLKLTIAYHTILNHDPNTLLKLQFQQFIYLQYPTPNPKSCFQFTQVLGHHLGERMKTRQRLPKFG